MLLTCGPADLGSQGLCCDHYLLTVIEPLVRIQVSRADPLQASLQL